MLCITIIVIFYVGIHASHLVLREYCLGSSNSKYRLVPEVRRDISMLMHQYRAIQIFWQTTMLFVGKFLVPFQSIFMTSSIFCNSMLIKNWKEMDTMTKAMVLFWTIAFTLAWSSILSLGGYLHKHGERVMVSWENHDFRTGYRNKLMKMVARSCKPAGINYRKCFVIRKGNVLKFLRSVLRGTLRAVLIMLKNRNSQQG